MGGGYITSQVKNNCNISDAHFWGHYSICGLLMRMRDLYKSEHGLMPWDAIPREEMSQWISSREDLWQKLEHEEIRPLKINGFDYDPLAIDGINAVLRIEGLVYGSGFGPFHKHAFFLGRLLDQREILDYSVHFIGRELCRDLSSSPAMLQGRCIYVRSDIIRSLCWDKFEELKTRRFGGLLEEMFGQYGITRSDTRTGDFHTRFDALSAAVAEILVLHEVGEAFEDDYEDKWLLLLASAQDKKSHFYLRGVKDLLADSSGKGPLSKIILKKDRPLLSVYLSMLDPIRRELCPEIMSSFQDFVDAGEWAVLERMRESLYQKSRDALKKIIFLWESDNAVPDVRQIFMSCGSIPGL